MAGIEIVAAPLTERHSAGTDSGLLLFLRSSADAMNGWFPWQSSGQQTGGLSCWCRPEHGRFFGAAEPPLC